jgi:glycosyltransferase involved in cell wall biosynthesis
VTASVTASVTPTILLVQPGPGERLSGGYLYNAQMAAHGAWELRNLAQADLDRGLGEISAGLVIADSIWLREQSIAPFLALAARGVRVAVLMHSFPSMISAAENGEAPRSEPTPFEIETLQQIGLVIAPGPHYPDLLRRHGVAAQICEPGVADSWRVPPRPRPHPGPCSLISVGAVTRRKGYLDVLEALAAYPPRDDYRWTVVGSLGADPAYAAQVAARAAQLGRVDLVDQRPPAQVRDLVVGSQLLVMPSYDENHPLVLLEAMAASVPSVGYAAGAAAGMLGDGARGLVGPIGDRTTLARNLARLIDDEPERYRMAEACWARQADLPSWAQAAANARAALEQRLSVR